MYRAISTAMLIAVLVLLAEPVWAADGVTEINQTRAMAGGVTAGDVAGFPVSISETGSYVLTSNLIVPDENTNAILLVTSSFVPIDVTIDLNGFTIQGPVVCNRDQGPTVCPGGGSGDGVTSGSFNGLVRVRNGTIRGMGGRAS